MSKKKLFDEESEDEIDIKTENEYAKKYDSWREKEEIHKLEQKYGPDALKSDGSLSSDSEDDSDGPPEISEEVEEQFLKTLALLKTKDPRIYDPSYKCFDQEEEKKTEEKSKAKTLTFDDSDDDDDGGDIFKIEKKAEIDEDEIDKKKEAPKKKKETKIKEYLTGKAEHVDEEVERDLAPLKALWSDPKLNEGEAFLRDYILNKRYLDDGDLGPAEERLRDDVDLEADEQTVEEQSKFERAYNFRFEEPDDEYLKRFPRTMNSIRPKDDRRSRKRAEVRTRKEEEKRKKMEEIGRLKALKLKEIQEKIAKIKEVTGNEELAFKEEDIEGDFDPEEHDRRMRALFDEQYYGDADHEKPVFPQLDEELEIENWDEYDVDAEPPAPAPDDDPHCEDDDFNMDADYNPSQPRANLLQEIQKTLGKKRRNRKKKSKLAEVLATQKPKFVPEASKSYDEYMEEYYKMDCEDVVGGDLPTRFKYREVVPNDYGLTIEEILLADDRELTQWVPLKKIVRHRAEAAERGDVRTYAQRAADQRLKKKVLPSLFKDLPEEPELLVSAEDGSKKKKKKNKKNKESGASEAAAAEDNDEHSTGAQEDDSQENDDAARTEDKEKKKLLKKTENTASENQQNVKEVSLAKTSDGPSDVKRKKNKKKKFNSAGNNADNSSDNENKVVIKKDHPSSTNVNSNNSKKKEPDNENTNKPKEVQGNVNGDTGVATNEVKNNKKRKRKQKDSNANTSNSNVNTGIGGNSQNNTNKKKKPNGDSFVVQKVSTQGPSQNSSKNTKTNNVVPSPGKAKPDNKNSKDVKSPNKGKKDFKKKLNPKDKFKKKFNEKNKSKKLKNKSGNDKANANPLTKLSDERLKAYGLNPKKYKNFLKYKKF